MSDYPPTPTTDRPRVHPGCVEAYQAGARAYPIGDEWPPAWWPWGIRQSYADGWWHSLWNAEGQSADV